MKILVLGGTGAMGSPLVNILCNKNNQVYVTSRKDKESIGNVIYIKGNAHDMEFITMLLSEQYDVIVDFMNYKPRELEERLDLFLSRTNQYIFFSSARVYADSQYPITELSPRLLDVSNDREFLNTDDYSLSKAREENLLMKSKKTNWTIIRPYITYNSQRLQLGVFEKEDWLYRALVGHSIVLPRDIANKITTMTFGGDVAEVIGAVIGKKEALGNIFQITTDEYASWNDILTIYLDTIEKRTGKRPSVVYAENSRTFQEVAPRYQVIYDRLFNRRFDSSKVKNLLHMQTYMDLKEGIEKSLNECLDSPEWRNINYNIQAWADRIAKEKTPLREINGGWEIKWIYIKQRYLYWIANPAENIIRKIKRKIKNIIKK